MYYYHCPSGNHQNRGDVHSESRFGPSNPDTNFFICFRRSGVTNTPHGGSVNCAQAKILGKPFHSQRTLDAQPSPLGIGLLRYDYFAVFDRLEAGRGPGPCGNPTYLMCTRRGQGRGGEGRGGEGRSRRGENAEKHEKLPLLVVMKNDYHMFCFLGTLPPTCMFTCTCYFPNTPTK